MPPGPGPWCVITAIPNLYSQKPKAFAEFDLAQLNLEGTPPRMADHFFNI